jgi:nitrogen fixation/metabolism regulation signal transduction histidine kinase
MVFKTFKNISLFYIVIVVFLTAVGVYVAFNTYFWLTSIWIFIIDIGVIVVLLKFVQKEYKKLSHFLLSVNQEDFTPPFSKSFQDLDLNKAFNQLSQVIVTLRDKAQVNYHYLQTIINQIDTAILCIGNSGKIVLANKSSNKLFKKSVLRNIDSLKISNENLPELLKKLKTGEKKLVKFEIEGGVYSYSIQVSKFKLLKDKFSLYSFQNVQSELEQNELESWQKLTRVLTHEIMNSAIPIANLSGIVFKILFDEDQFNKNVDTEQVADIKESIETIKTRSAGLVKFVEATRSFTKMPKPEFQDVNIESTINRILSLLKSKLKDSGININTNFPSEEITILADQALIEQAFLNIILNAIDALLGTHKPVLNIEVKKNDKNRILVIIKDNGKGITSEELENIFIPFYTTKIDGSGIGLSLTRQIMYLHKGNIYATSVPNKSTVFTLSF